MPLGEGEGKGGLYKNTGSQRYMGGHRVSETVGRLFWLEVPADMYNTPHRVCDFTSFHCGHECSPGTEEPKLR